MRSVLFSKEELPDSVVDFIRGTVESIRRTGTPVLISHEAFLGARSWNVSAEEARARARRLFPDARILLVSRPANELARSAYRDHPIHRDTGAPVSFAQWERRESAADGILPTLDTARVVAQWKKHFHQVVHAHFSATGSLAPQVSPALMDWLRDVVGEDELYDRLNHAGRRNPSSSQLEHVARLGKLGLRALFRKLRHWPRT